MRRIGLSSALGVMIFAALMSRAALAESQGVRPSFDAVSLKERSAPLVGLVHEPSAGSLNADPDAQSGRPLRIDPRAERGRRLVQRDDASSEYRVDDVSKREQRDEGDEVIQLHAAKQRITPTHGSSSCRPA
jgi:hypothetical protein